MKLTPIRLPTLVFLVTCSSARAFASDWYVDAVNGNNANSGASATSAWRTISFAIANTPTTGAQTIHVAAGTYDTALGEGFPFVMRDQLQVTGAGKSATQVNPPPGQIAFSMSLTSGPPYIASVLITDLKIVGGSRGVSLVAPSTTVTNATVIHATLRNLEIQQAQHGLDFQASDTNGSRIEATIEFVEVHSCNVGLHCDDSAVVAVADSSVHDNTGHGVEASGSVSTCSLTLRRCRVDHNGGDGIHASYCCNYAGVGTQLEDCSVSRNAASGWFAVPASSYYSGASAVVLRSTVAHNGTFGLSANGYFDGATVKNSIVWGNADDVDGFVTSTNSDIGEPVNGTANLMADPLFENVAGGDLRLRFGSPCIDAMTTWPPIGTLDLARHLRNADGDLNNSGYPDLGAFEFRPLEFVGTAQLGTSMTLELRGPQGAASTLYWTRGALAATPMGTQSGQFWLQPSLAHVYRVVTVGSVVPTLVQRTIPNSPFLVGQTFAFQARTDNPLAPAGNAYTNAVQFTIVP